MGRMLSARVPRMHGRVHAHKHRRSGSSQGVCVRLRAPRSSDPPCLIIVCCIQTWNPDKPHPHSAWYHTIACAKSKAIFYMECRIPAKYSLKHHNVRREFDDKGFPISPKTCALLLRATRSIWHSHRVVVMDAAFTSVAALVCMRIMVLYYSARLLFHSILGLGTAETTQSLGNYDVEAKGHILR